MTNNWKTTEKSDQFLNNIRGAMPFADVQIEVLVKIISVWNPNIKKVVDLGCGDGILGRAILNNYPEIELSCVDFSEPMLERAKNNFQKNELVDFINADLSNSDWKDVFNKSGGFDLIIAGFAIHHLTNNRKKELYKEIYELLNRGGIFLNLDHVAPTTKDLENIYNDLFIDKLFLYQRKNNLDISREMIAKKYLSSHNKEEIVLTSLEVQCEWLREIGYQNVDCYLKMFELALFGGRKSVA